MINCMLIDDDANVLFSLRSYVEQTPFLHLIAAHQRPTDALMTLQTNDIQLIFMDIGMPEINGMELSRLISSQKGPSPAIIFITAHEDFALEGYKVKALDYLLKPLDYETFLAAAFRAKEVLDSVPRVYTDSDHLFLRVERDLQKVYLKNILYLESFKDYVKVFMVPPPSFIKGLGPMKSIEDKLPADSFIRIHRSFIVSVDKIDSITKSQIKIGQTIIPVSEQYRTVFKKLTDKWLT